MMDFFEETKKQPPFGNCLSTIYHEVFYLSTDFITIELFTIGCLTLVRIFLLSVLSLTHFIVLSVSF